MPHGEVLVVASYEDQIDSPTKFSPLYLNRFFLIEFEAWCWIHFYFLNEELSFCNIWNHFATGNDRAIMNDSSFFLCTLINARFWTMDFMSTAFQVTYVSCILDISLPHLYATLMLLLDHESWNFLFSFVLFCVLGPCNTWLIHLRRLKNLLVALPCNMGMDAWVLTCACTCALTFGPIWVVRCVFFYILKSSPHVNSFIHFNCQWILSWPKCMYAL